jgi:two-component system, sensor histidine kinase and response regulator
MKDEPARGADSAIDAATPRAVVLLLAGLCFAVIFAARFAVEGAASGVTFLYVVPIVILAMELGLRGGLAAAAVALALFAAWDVLSAPDVDAIAYLSRAAVFALIGVLVGYMAARLRAAARSAEATARHFALAQDMLCTARFDGYFVDLNPAWEQTLGWTADELKSRPFLDFVHPDDRVQTEREAAALSTGAVTVAFTNRYRTKSGGWRWIEWSARAEVDQGLIYAAARDITARREAEQAQREAEERFRRAFEDSAIGMGVVVVAELDEHHLVEANDALCRMLGYAREDLVGQRTLVDLAHPDHLAELRAGIHRLLDGVDPVLRRELRVVRADGSPLWVELTTSLVRDEDGRPIYRISQVVDVDARRRAEEALREAHEQAIEASRLKSEFVANMSHEIRTPLNGVVGMADLMIETELTAEQRGYAEALRVSADALMAVIDDILDFSKIEAGKLEIEASDLVVRELLGAACAVVAPQAHAKDLELIAWCDPAVPAAVRADAHRIRQILTNLLGNAVKFTHRGEVMVRVAPDPGDPEVLRFEVSDTGIGVEPEKLGHLFDAFAQADGSTTRRYGGTGLGLAICKQLVELMGGQIGVESEVDAGSRFWFTVPVVEATDAAEPAPRAVELAGTRVLVVDDNDTNRSILAGQVSAWGMECDTAAGGDEALALARAAAREGRPHAIGLLDFQMPGMSGFELAEALRREPGLRAMRLIVLSSAGAGRDTAAGVEVDAFLTKPVLQDALREEIARVLGGVAAREWPARDPRAAPATPRAAAGGDGPRVLVAEDDPVSRRVIATRLERLGCRVDTAADGREAVRLSDGADYAVIFMDCQMPVVDGYAATAEIRARERGDGRRTPIVALTAHAVEGDRERCIAAGMDDYVAKPLRPQDIERVLDRFVSSGPDGDTPLLDEAVVEDVLADGGAEAGLVEMFLAESRARVTELGEAVGAADAARAARVVHSLKGSCATFGAARMAALAQGLSDDEAPEAIARAAAIHGELERALELTATALEGAVSR